MRHRSQLLCFVFAGLMSAPGFAQRGGKGSGGGGGGPPSPKDAADEAAQARAAKEWSDAIEKTRAKAPPPPLPQIRWPTENEKLLSRLRYAEDPKKELATYLDKLWKGAKEAAQQRSAVEQLWKDAEKPAWVRPAIEAFFKQRSNGMALRSPPPEPAELTKSDPAPAPAPAPASAPPPPTATK